MEFPIRESGSKSLHAWHGTFEGSREGHNQVSPRDFAKVGLLLLEHPNLQVGVAIGRANTI
jgi:hypothetical protein